MPVWTLMPLGDVCTLQRGFDLPIQDRRPGAYALVSSSGVIDAHDQGVVSGPGVVTGRSGSIGNVFYIEESFWPLNTALYVRDFHNNDSRFVYYLLTAFDLKRFAGGTGVPTLNRNDVHSALVPMPSSVEEQRRIVAILDEAFAGIATAKANAEKNLLNAQELFDTSLGTAFSQHAGLVRLSNCTTAISDGDHAPPPKALAGVPFITISNVEKETRRIDFNDTFLVSREYFQAVKPHRKPQHGDVLYTVTGSFGIPVLVEDDAEFCFQRHIGLVRPGLDIDSRWLAYALLSPQVRAQAEAGATGTAQRTVSLGALRGFLIPKVGIEDQRRIAAQVDVLYEEVMRLKRIARSKLAALDELKRSLLHQAFTGGLS